MRQVSIDMAEYIEEHLGKEIGYVGQTIFVGDDVPPASSLAISIIDTGSLGPDSPNIPYKTTKFSIMVRVSPGNYTKGMEVSEMVRDLLHGDVGFFVGSTWYIQVFQLNGPTYIGKDSQNNSLFSTNYRTLRTLKTL